MKKKIILLLGIFFINMPSTFAACGDNVVDYVEQCDDGNVLSGDGCSKTCKYELIGEKVAIIRTPENFVHSSAAEEKLNLFKEKGITTIILLVKNDEDLAHMDSGEVFYNSSIAPIAFDYQSFNFDALAYVVDFARDNNMKIYAWLPQFHDKVVVDGNADLQMRQIDVNGNIDFYNPNGEYFVNPISPEVRNYEISLLKEVAQNYDIDGIFLDWIRFDDYNMDFSVYTINKFQNSYNINPMEIDFSTDNEQRRAWNEFRENEIATFVSQASQEIKEIKEKLAVGVFILPLEMKEVAQNPSKFEDSLDFVAPILYNDDWGYPESWIYDTAVVDATDNMTDNSKILVTLDVDYCSKFDLWNNIYLKGAKQKACFYYGDWSEGEVNKIKVNNSVDVNIDTLVNSTDAMLTLRNSLGLNMSNTNWFSSTTTGDVNCDNISNSTDAMLILRHSLGLDMTGTGWCE
jgi:cysteine-rich repeat protein